MRARGEIFLGGREGGGFVVLRSLLLRVWGFVGVLQDGDCDARYPPQLRS
jgi:hypothetical protein